MDVSDAIKQRYSCRSYESRPIEIGKLTDVLDSARLAPSAMNLQDWRLVVVTEAQTKAKLAAAANDQKFIATAAAVIVACSNSNHIMRCGQSVGPIDVSIALEHIALRATSLGLGTCWIGSFYPEQVKTVLAIPEDVVVIEVMTIGYPSKEQPKTKREPIEKIVCYEKWLF